MNKDRLANIKGITVHDICFGLGCDECNNTGTNYQLSVSDWIRLRDELLSEVSRLVGELQVVTNFKADADHINRLSDPLRGYIYDLETLCDPAGLVQENAMLRDQNKELLVHMSA